MAWHLAAAAPLYRCSDAGVISYRQTPCGNVDPNAMPVDRATPGDAVAGTTAPLAGPPAPHRLTQAERERIARLRRDEPQLTAEGRIAAEVEIAAIREGADARLSAEDRAALELLRAQLRSPDAKLRADALTQWRALYARYRISAHPHVQLSPASPGADMSRSAVPEPPLGATLPGTRGPLAAPPSAPVLTAPSRPAPVADPNTGRVLAPVGSDRMIDPLTGTLWMRSGRVYVDPLSGRIIPAP